jgi:hypothetical protein
VTLSAAQKPSEWSTLFAVNWNSAGWTLSLSVSAWLLALACLLLLIFVIWRLLVGFGPVRSMEIDEANFGFGEQKIKLKPNLTDKQIAYAIWVELSTRKIGLPIDFEDDVISEIYDSWYGFFAVTRELVKGVPVQKVGRDSTQKIIRLSIDVLNQGLRPHLTKWQARFRHWYDRELKRYDDAKDQSVLDPQMIQQKFPKYQELIDDMERVNETLMNYRREMHRLVLKD